MLKPKALTKVLEQANTGGVRCTLLLNSEGTLMAYAGKSDKKETVTAAIAANIWMSNERGAYSGQLADLTFIVLDCMDGKVAIRKVAGLLLCMYTNSTIGLGLLKAKADVLAGYLETPLSQIASSSSS
ncbi:hypothetical protein EMCRGX_G027694 [Ephydatia muelleri]